MSPLAAARCLEAVRIGLDLPLARGQEVEAALFGLCFASEDMREGTAAFLEKRPPRFTGEVALTPPTAGMCCAAGARPLLSSTA